MFAFIRHSKIWFTLSSIAVGLSLAVFAIFGLNFGIDFTGGSLLELQFQQTVTPEQIAETLSTSELDLGEPIITPADSGAFLIRVRYLEEDERTQLDSTLGKSLGSFETLRFTTTGPTLGKSLRERAVRAIIYASIAIVMYLAAVFRNTRRDSLTKYVSIGSILGFGTIIAETMVEDDFTRWMLFLAIVALFLVFMVLEIRKNSPSLKYGVCAIVALVHDITITLGVLVILGQFFGVEINSLTVTALLTILGFSVHDTIVVFDRMRENRKFQTASESLSMVADKSLNQTLTRSINTSFSTLIVLAILFWLGAESIKWFVFTLLCGVVVGTYSSIFTATPLLVYWENRNRR
ncbi:MAG: protein translocase subunit SecF [Candidatus Peribacteraceae bacterium]|nr:protein translocase subunit SecF [Candidatus Peribacteraceae bacterium]